MYINLKYILDKAMKMLNSILKYMIVYDRNYINEVEK